MSLANQSRVVIVGAGHAGGRFALHLRASGFGGPVLVIGQEPELPYERPPLSKEFLLTNGRDRHAPLAGAKGWAELDVSFALNAQAVSLRPQNRAVHLSDGNAVEYDQLVIATGAAPRELQVPGGTGPRVFTLRTVADAVTLRAHLSTARRIAIVGGGVIGLEVAAAARQKGVDVTIIEAGDRVMARIVPPLVSEWIDALHRAHGVRFYYRTAVRSIESSNTGAVTVMTQTSSGIEDEVPADFVVVAIGVTPSSGWLEGSGLPVAQGVTVDAFCRSPADGSCYAVGDVASTWHTRYGRPLRQETWRNAENQARAAAEIMCGRAEPFVETPWMWSDQYDANIQMLGLAEGAETHILRGNPLAGAFCWIGMREDIPVGAALINCSRDRRALEALVSSGSRVDVTKLPDRGAPLHRLSA